MTKETSRVISTRSGVTRNGRVWYQVNGKFCNKATYFAANVRLDIDEASETIQRTDKIFVIGYLLLVLLFVGIPLGIVQDVHIVFAGIYQLIPVEWSLQVVSQSGTVVTMQV